MNPNIASGSPSDAELVQRLQDMETKAVALEVQAAVSKVILHFPASRFLFVLETDFILVQIVCLSFLVYG